MISIESGVYNKSETVAERHYEVMKAPEIVFQQERGAQLLSLLLKAENPEWGETKTPLSQEVSDYFNNNPIPENIRGTIRSFYEQGVDEETLYNLALTYQHPERAKHIFDLAAKYKPHVLNSEDVHQRLTEALGAFDNLYSSTPLAEKIDAGIELDRKTRAERHQETRERIESLIDFYKPDIETSDIKKVSFVPTDPLYRKNSGRAFSTLPGEQIIISHIDNVDNQDHEFSHGIINPVVEKLCNQLSEEQKKKVSELASGSLKEDYGEGHFSLLCEEFIRTYNDVLRHGEMPQTYDELMRKISKIDDEQFQELKAESENVNRRFEEMGIQTLDDLKEHAREYFERFQQNRLRDLIFDLYLEYKAQQNIAGDNFEQFVLKNFQGKLETVK